MKIKYLTLLLLSSILMHSQALTEKIGEIEVQYIPHYYKRNSELELTKKKSNKHNRPAAVVYFNSNGIVLKSISFGKHHNNSLKLLNQVILYKYLDKRLVYKIIYESDYEKNIYPFFKECYLYNTGGNLIEKSRYWCENDSIFNKETYEYNASSNRTKTIFSPSYYLEREYDSINRLKSLKQIYDNKLRWEWNYTYTENQRIGNFQTYYDDGNNYSEKEISSYNDKGLLIEFEKKHHYNEKTKIFYNKKGIIKRIELYESFDNEPYKITFYAKYKVKSKTKITSDLAKKINESFYDK